MSGDETVVTSCSGGDESVYTQKGWGNRSVRTSKSVFGENDTIVSVS